MSGRFEKRVPLPPAELREVAIFCCAWGDFLPIREGSRGLTEKTAAFEDQNHAQTRIKTGRNARFCGRWRTLHPMLIMIKINDLRGIDFPRKGDSGTGAGILQNCSLLTSFPPWLPPIISANQPALPSLGGNHGILRRVDAKAT